MGHPDELFHATEEMYDVKCMICLLVIDTPRKMTNCSHHFCEDCLQEWLSEANTCPQCVQVGEAGPPNLELIRKIRALPTKCYYSSLGCEEKVPFGNMDRHILNCSYRIVQCPRRCGCSMPMLDVPTHLLSCRMAGDPLVASMMCYKCKFMYTNGGYPSHCDYYLTARNVWHSDPHKWRHANANRLRGDGTSTATRAGTGDSTSGSNTQHST